MTRRSEPPRATNPPISPLMVRNCAGPSPSGARPRVRWRSCTAMLASISRRKGRSMSRPASSSRCMSHAEIRVPSTSGRQPIGCRAGRVSSQLWISARAASRAASPALTRSASQPKPCQAASHSGPAPDGNQAGDGLRTSSPTNSMSPARIAAPRFGSPGQFSPIGPRGLSGTRPFSEVRGRGAVVRTRNAPCRSRSRKAVATGPAVSLLRGRSTMPCRNKESGSRQAPARIAAPGGQPRLTRRAL